MKNPLLKLLPGLLMAFFIFSIIIFNFHLNKPPEVIGADSPLDVFSAERAAEHLPYIASEPTPIGSKAHENAREYILGQLEKAGLDPEIQTIEYYYGGKTALLNNVVARQRGQGKGEAIIFMSHYDSVVSAPGASDNGSAVITLLELARLLQYHPPLENDIIFLFSDGEERDLLGAQAFFAHHPYAEDISLVFNFEAMGTSGQSIMFETGDDNLEIIEEFARAVPFPFGNSISVEIYKRMPNSTDFAVAKYLDLQGLNFAYIGESYNYHTPGDNISNTDLRSVQHHGSYAQALALHFGNFIPENYVDENAVYFNILGYVFIHYPYSYVMPFIGGLIVLALLIMIPAILKRKISLSGILIALVSLFFLLLILFELFSSAYSILTSYYAEEDLRLLQYNSQGILIGFSLLAAAVCMYFFNMILRGAGVLLPAILIIIVSTLAYLSGDLIWWKLIILAVALLWFIFANRKPAGIWDVYSGALIIWLMVAAYTGFSVPGASYLLCWPLLAALIPFGISVFAGKENKIHHWEAILWLVFSLPVLFLFPSIINLFRLAMGLSLAGIIVAFIGFGIIILLPIAVYMMRGKWWLMPALIFITGMAFLIQNTVNLDYDENHKKANLIVHATNVNLTESYWLAPGQKIDPWLENFISTHPEMVDYSQFYPFSDKVVPGKQTDLWHPGLQQMTIVADSIHNQERVFSLWLQPGGTPGEIEFFINAEDSPVWVLTPTDRKEMLKPAGKTFWYRFTYLAPPDEGIDVTFYIRKGKQLRIHVNEVEYNDLARFDDYKDRPPFMMTKGDRIITSYLYLF